MLFRSVKIVRVRKDHNCEVCSKAIPKGSRALVEGGFNREGYWQSYFHIPTDGDCYLDYFDAMQPNQSVQMIEKIRDPAFIGQLEYEHWREHDQGFDNSSPVRGIFEYFP